MRKWNLVQDGVRFSCAVISIVVDKGNVGNVHGRARVLTRRRRRMTFSRCLPGDLPHQPPVFIGGTHDAPQNRRTAVSETDCVPSLALLSFAAAIGIPPPFSKTGVVVPGPLSRSGATFPNHIDLVSRTDFFARESCPLAAWHGLQNGLVVPQFGNCDLHHTGGTSMYLNLIAA